MNLLKIIDQNEFATKKEVISIATDIANDIIDKGEHNLYEMFAKISRLETAIETVKTKIKDKLPNENFESFGLKGVYKNGGAIPNYLEDLIYADLHNQLKEREALLKTALNVKDTIYDSEGIEVPKVSLNQRKSTLNIIF